MNVPFYIAKRYLFGKKSFAAIDIISLIGVCGVAIATMALVCVLSVFNGFKDLLEGLFTCFDPPLRIENRNGETFAIDSLCLQQLKEIEGVEQVHETLEGQVLMRYKERQIVGIVKGVPKDYGESLQLQQLMKRGEFMLYSGDTLCAVAGLGIYAVLGCKRDEGEPLILYAPKRKGKINIVNPFLSIHKEEVLVKGAYAIFQPKYDEHYLFVPIEAARKLLDYPKEVSSLDVFFSSKGQVNRIKRAVRNVLKDKTFSVKDRFEQQEESFKMMKIEKWVTFLILIFILLIAFFNCLGSLSMLIIDKREECKLLHALGETKDRIQKIFLWEGYMMGLSGAIIGVILGVVLCGLQEKYGFLKLGDAASVFLTEVYPVRLFWGDVVIIFVASTLIGVLTAHFTIRKTQVS